MNKFNNLIKLKKKLQINFHNFELALLENNQAKIVRYLHKD